jgi:ribonuclease HI
MENIVFTDGACSGNPGPGGWAAIVASPQGRVVELGGYEKQTTNNRMELRAAIEALRFLSTRKKLSTPKVRLFTDSKYVIQGITQWIYGWEKKGWLTAEGKPVSNKEDWIELRKWTESVSVSWEYVPGHQGIPGNERCDTLAVAYSQGFVPELFLGERNHYKVSLEVDTGPPSPAWKKPLYLSLVHGQLERHESWDQCAARTKGQKGAKFKKVSSASEERALLKDWGLS